MRAVKLYHFMRNIIIIAVLLLLLLLLLCRYYFHYTIRCKLPCTAAVILARPLIFATVVENIYYRGHENIYYQAGGPFES